MAAEYGWTYDEIAQCSMREIDIALRKIHRRRHNAYAQEAVLHGVRIDFMQDQDDLDEKRAADASIYSRLTPDEDAAIDAAIKASLERKKGGRIHG